MANIDNNVMVIIAMRSVGKQDGLILNRLIVLRYFSKSIHGIIADNNKKANKMVYKKLNDGSQPKSNISSNGRTIPAIAMTNKSIKYPFEVKIFFLKV